MARRYEIDDAQWEKIKPFLGNTPKKTGRPQADNRNLLNGVLWIMHTGAPWRDPPGYYGPWQTVYKRFSQWEKDEKLKQLYLHSLRRCPFLGMHRSGRKYQYSYNSRGQLIGYTELAVRENAYTDLSQSFFWYDDLNRLDYAQTTFRYAVGDTNYLSEADYYDAVGYGYAYDNSASGRDGSGVGVLTELEIFGGGLRHGATISYGYDSMYRLTEKTTTANENAGFSQTVSYGYRQLGSGRTTGQVSSYRSEVNGTATAYTYTYGSNGNITRITDQSGKVTRYTYDKLGQLTREDNPYLNKTYVYTYDNAGNRLSKKTYAYTTGTPGNATATESYNYTGDRLTQVGSTVYQYGAIGNPTTYNGYTLEWNGRKLMEMSMNGGQFLYTFAYNADGIRTVKTNGSTIHHYTLNGSQIVTETWTTKSSSGAETPNHFLVYLYDENGAPVGLQYRSKSDAKNVFYTYYFEKNLQGDIIAIYTESGTKIGSYTYDAWGNCTISTESGTTTIQKRIVRTLNPFRYRMNGEVLWFLVALELA